MGDVRGRNDAIDAQRIARYAYKNRDEIKLYVPPRAIIDQLDNLLDIRERLVKVRQICLTALNEQKSCEANKTLTKDTKKYSAHTLKGVETDLLTLEKQSQRQPAQRTHWFWPAAQITLWKYYRTSGLALFQG